MTEVFLQAVQDSKVGVVLAVVVIVQFWVNVYLGKYALKDTVHKDYFYEATRQADKALDKLDDIKQTVENTNTRMEEHNRNN